MRHLSRLFQDIKTYLANALHVVGKPLPYSGFRVTGGWDNGGIFDWYRMQRHTTISKLELRKERDRFKHEYIVIYLDNGWVHRIERRPIGAANRNTISKDGCEAEDGLTPVSDRDLEVIRSETDVEITLEFPSNKPDLYNVIAVAVAIHLDPQARRYTLQLYNSYFMARSIIALITRHCLLHAPLLTRLRWDRITESAILDDIFGSYIKQLAMLIKASILADIDDLPWDIIKKNARMRIKNNRDWDLLRDIVRRVIHEEVERSSEALPSHDMQRVVNKWLMDIAQATLWHENHLSDRRHTGQRETTVKDVRPNVALKPELVTHLLGNMSKVLSDILPKHLINNIPVDFPDQIREAIVQSSAFEGKELKQQLLQIARAMLRQLLVMSSGELPATIIQVSVRAKQIQGTDRKLLRHEDLQDHILSMNRVHSKMVAQVPLLGMGEERVYEGLHRKMEEIWKVMRLHPSMPGRS